MKKLRAEKRAFDKYQKASKAFPNKQEREELKELKDEVGVIYDIAFELFAMHCAIERRITGADSDYRNVCTCEP